MIRLSVIKCNIKFRCKKWKLEAKKKILVLLISNTKKLALNLAPVMKRKYCNVEMV